MKKYKVKISIPYSNNRWQAKIEERCIEAENLNYLIMRAATVEEYKNGARICEIWERQNDEYGSYQRIK